ncbi:hypothetical protein CJF30_00002467 [Rutstroemia sp. NJR-2017a BBW]|nr:hypothetical protein CJF30_00002467 [Rutstroemia sp. NJR-2017a BBW]
MDRQDSGYAENITPIPSHVRSSSRPSSTSSSSRPRPSLSATRRSSTRSSTTSTSRSTPKRPSKSRTSTSQSRTSISQSRPRQPSQQYQYFQFPSLEDDLPPPPPPPATIHYWTSDQTRRLEYAAIDAASKGIRGLVTRCIPDCFLPVESRRRRFCKGEDKDDEDAGSVRRYRLVMAEEGGDGEKKKGGRKGRWRGFWRW